MNFAIKYLFMGMLLASTVVRPEITDDKQTVEKIDSNANVTGIVEKISTYSAPFISHVGDVSGPINDFSRTLFTSAVVFSGVTLAVALIWLTAPLLGYKFCTLLGNCSNDGITGGGVSSNLGNGEESVVVNGNEEASSLFPFSSVGYRYNAPYGGYRKRSLNYVGPILKTLSSAYEKFEEFSTSTPKIE